jgi:hypothetical protein
MACVHPAGDKLDIKEGPQGLYIPNLRIEAVNGPEDVAAVLQKGKQNRSTFATNMNEHTSRSHLVLSLYVTAKHLTKGRSGSCLTLLQGRPKTWQLALSMPQAAHV